MDKKTAFNSFIIITTPLIKIEYSQQNPKKLKINKIFVSFHVYSFIINYITLLKMKNNHQKVKKLK